MTDRARELLEQALENWDRPVTGNFKRIFEEIRAYLEQPEVKPFVRLSEEEMQKVVRKTGICWDVARAIEDALEGKNK